MRDEILKHLEARDRLSDKGTDAAELAKGNWVMAALELLLRAELARQDPKRPAR